MFQDIEPKRFDNAFAWVNPEPHDRVLVYRGAKVLLAGVDAQTGEPDSIHFPSYAALERAGVVSRAAAEGGTPRADGAYPLGVLLFTVGDTAYFRCEVDEAALDALLVGEQQGLAYAFCPINRLSKHGPKYRVFAGMVGYEYHMWYSTRRFCGRCGAPMVYGLPERMLQCPECGCQEYSRLFPAVIVAVVDRQRDRVLVSRYAGREYTRYALIAGFSEMGETVEQTVHREVMEEVGLRVKNLRYYKSQPWPPSNSLLFGFFCDLDGSPEIRLDDHELEVAEWIAREDLPPEDADYSLTRDMMRVLRERRE